MKSHIAMRELLIRRYHAMPGYPEEQYDEHYGGVFVTLEEIKRTYAECGFNVFKKYGVPVYEKHIDLWLFIDLIKPFTIVKNEEYVKGYLLNTGHARRTE